MSDSAPSSAPAPSDQPALPPASTASLGEAAPVSAGTADPGSPPPPVEPPPLPPPILPPPRLYLDPQPLVFHGEAREFFRIWIVNTLLTLLTLGLFSAWAKVRRRRYLRGNTELLGHRFDYTADPRRLLIGHLVIAVVFLGYAVFGAVYPVVLFITVGVGLLFLPYVLVRSAVFNASNTVYRGLRFRFHPSYARPTFLYFLALPVMLLFSFGLLYPRWEKMRREWLVGGHRFGTAFFRLETPTSEFYTAIILGGAIVGVPVFGASMLLGAILGASGKMDPGQQQTLGYVIISLSVALSFVARHFIYARLFNSLWNHTRLDEHRFVARLPLWGWLKLQLVNLVAIIFSCGLLYPWAVIRSTRLAVSSLAIVPTAAGIDRIEVLESKRRDGAFGDTAAEFAGFDFGL